MKRFLGLFSKENSVRAASLILMVTLALSNLLGLLRDRFLTKNIPTFNLDIYYASFRIPDLVFNLIILGAITSAFIPVLSGYVAKKDLEEGFKVTNLLLNTALLCIVIAATILIIFMPHLMPLVVPKFDQARLNEAIKYSRLMMITPIFFSISYISSGVLNTFNRFVAYSFAPIIYNLSIIFGAALLAPRFGLISVVYCVIAGSALHFLVQMPSLLKVGFRYHPILDLRNKAVRKIITLMVPRAMGTGVNQIMIIAFTAIASSLAAGSIAAFELSNNIQTMPTVVFGTSFATAIFPTLTLKAASGEMDRFTFYLNRSVRAISFLLIPSTVIFFLLRAQIVRLILGSGKFNWDDTEMTALTLGFFSLSLLFQGLVPLLARAFYALKDTKTPMYLSFCTVLVSVLFAYPLSRMMGVAGLAFAFSIGNLFNALSLFFYLRRRCNGFINFGVVSSIFKILLNSVVMAVAVWGTMHLVSNYVDMERFWGILVQASASVVAGLLIYYIFSRIFDCEEIKWVISRKVKETGLSADGLKEIEYEQV